LTGDGLGSAIPTFTGVTTVAFGLVYCGRDGWSGQLGCVRRRLLPRGFVRRRLQFGFACIGAALGFDRWFAPRLLGLERLEGAQRAPELGERAAAIAQERVEAARAVAVADQGQTEAAADKAVLGEQLPLKPLGPLEPPGGGDDPAREHGLERARGCQFCEQRGLERGECGGALARQHDALLRAKTVLKGVLCRAGLAVWGFRATRFRAIAATGCGTGGAQEGRRGGGHRGHGGVPWRVMDGGVRASGPGGVSLTKYRNIVQRCGRACQRRFLPAAGAFRRVWR
jgi:hypothetical protein